MGFSPMPAMLLVLHWNGSQVSHGMAVDSNSCSFGHGTHSLCLPAEVNGTLGVSGKDFSSSCLKLLLLLWTASFPGTLAENTSQRGAES